jgi:hypothetical protein
MSDESNVAAAKEQPPIPTIKSVGPGVEKSLEFHKVKDGTPPKVDDDKVRLTIVNDQGEKESVVVLYGDINMALSVLGHNPAQAGGGGIPVDGSTPVGEPTNEGEDLTRTGSNPELDPVNPGVEPENAPVEGEGAPNAPVSTDPGGNTAQQTAPDVTAPEPEGANVTTNPGTESTSDAQTEVPQPAEPTPGVDPEATPADPPTVPAAARPWVLTGPAECGRAPAPSRMERCGGFAASGGAARNQPGFHPVGLPHAPASYRLGKRPGEVRSLEPVVHGSPRVAGFLDHAVDRPELRRGLTVVWLLQEPIQPVTQGDRADAIEGHGGDDLAHVEPLAGNADRQGQGRPHGRLA